MKNVICSLLIFMCALIYSPLDALAQEEGQPAFWSSAAEDLQWRGSFLSDNRMHTYKGANNLSWQEHRLSLTPELRGQRTRFHSEIWIRSFRFPSMDSYTDLSDKSKLNPLDIDLREAYFDVYDFIIPQLDLRVGRQRHAWGTADRLNPTDNLNPYDLEDIWDFGRHLSSNSIKLTYYWRDFTLSGVFIPYFTPLHAPEASVMEAFMPEINLPSSQNIGALTTNLIYGNIEDELSLPERHIKNAVYGFRLEKPFGAFNTSVSYMKGYDILPAPFKTVVTSTDLSLFPLPDTIKLDVYSHLCFAPQHVIGLDVAGAIGNVGVWGEAALFMPEEIVNKTQLAGFPIAFDDSVTVEGTPYVKYIVGMDYTFTNGVYLNAQYLHGFFHERGNELSDYLVVALDIPAFRNRISFSPLNASLQIKDFGDIRNNYGWVLMPEVSYTGIDNAGFTVGARFIDGSENTLFGRMKNQRDVFLKLTYAF